MVNGLQGLAFLAQGIVSPLARDGDTRQVGGGLNQLEVRGLWVAGLTVVHAKGSKNLAPSGHDGDGIAGTKAVAQGQRAPLALPAVVGGDILDDDVHPKMRGPAAGSEIERRDRGVRERVDEGVRKTGGEAEVELLPLGVADENRAEHAIGLFFDQAE